MATAPNLTSLSPAITAAATASKYRVIRNVVIPLWKWVDEEVKAFKVESKIFKGEAMADKSGAKEDAKAQMEPADLMVVWNLETGEKMQIIVGKVLRAELEKAYPKETYVGKCFISKQYKIQQKRYRGYTLDEIQDPTKA